MNEWKSIETRLHAALTLSRRPVAVAFCDEPPAGVPKFTGSEPSGCSFWRLAAQGRTFYTVPADHFNCAIGSYTHNMPLPPERGQELEQTLDLMTGIGYIRMEEVSGITRLPRTPAAVVYAPLGEMPVGPDRHFSERGVDDRGGRSWQARDPGDLFHPDVSDPGHQVESLLELLTTLRGKRHVVSIASDRAVEVIGRNCVEGPPLRGEPPEATT